MDLLNAAVDMYRTETWRLIQQTSFTGYIDKWETIQFELYPITGITSVKYYDTSGTLQTLATSDYEYSLNGSYGRLRFINTYNLRDKDYDNIEIAFTAGYATSEEVPDEDMRIIMHLVRDMYDHRSSATYGGVKEVQLPMGLKYSIASRSLVKP